MSDCHVKVSAESTFNAENSHPEKKHYLFDYTITLENISEENATLLRRHWFITDADGHIEEVEGEGVIGQFPTLIKGRPFTYSSHAIIKTEVGTMHGYYHLRTHNGKEYIVDIPAFRLSNIGWLH